MVYQDGVHFSNVVSKYKKVMEFEGIFAVKKILSIWLVDPVNNHLSGCRLSWREVNVHNRVDYSALREELQEYRRRSKLGKFDKILLNCHNTILHC